MELTLEEKKQIIHKHTQTYTMAYKKSLNTYKYTNYIHYYKLKVLEKCTKNLIGHSRLAFNNHESNIDC